jgi:uncharacterized protein (TIGR01244 family)
MMRRLAQTIFVSGQIDPGEVGSLARQGITVLINNRPDGEEPGQPLASDIEEAARTAGIAYHFVPIRRGIGPADVEAMQAALGEAAGGNLLAFCRSGTRSALALALARRENGAPAAEVRQSLVEAGFDPSPILHLL